MDDVTNAFELVEAQGGHRITKQGQIFSNAVLEVARRESTERAPVVAGKGA